jgi:hypothetical protein
MDPSAIKNFPVGIIAVVKTALKKKLDDIIVCSQSQRPVVLPSFEASS